MSSKLFSTYNLIFHQRDEERLWKWINLLQVIIKLQELKKLSFTHPLHKCKVRGMLVFNLIKVSLNPLLHLHMILAGLKRILHLWHGPRVADEVSTIILDPTQPLFFCHVCKTEKPPELSVCGHGLDIWTWGHNEGAFTAEIHLYPFRAGSGLLGIRRIGSGGPAPQWISSEISIEQDPICNYHTMPQPIGADGIRVWLDWQ